MKNNKLVIGGVVLAVVLSLLAVFTHVGPQGPEGKPGISFGATPGPDSTQPCAALGGVRTCRYSIAMNTASSTLCVFPKPTASSTLVSFTAIITTATGTITQVNLATATIPFAPSVTVATTSLIATDAIAANTGGGTSGTGFTWVYNGATTTTPTLRAAQSTIKPTEFLIFSARGGGGISDTGSGQVFAGRCNVVTQEQ